jgi:hypothetical protein
LFSTHPPTEKRITILRSMGGGAGLAEYEAAYRQVHGARARCIGARTLSTETRVPARAPSPPEQTKEHAVARAREVGDLVAGLANFVFIPCACGVRIKVPPNFTRSSLSCPRCGRQHDVPTAAGSAAAAAAGPGAPAAGAADPAPRYVRKGSGWESFRCSCGGTVQLSPAFSAPQATCPKCQRVFEIVQGGK